MNLNFLSNLYYTKFFSPAGSITVEDILTVAPFRNTIDIVELRGRDVIEMFEHSVSDYDTEGVDPAGRFLQVSGKAVVIFN